MGVTLIRKVALLVLLAGLAAPSARATETTADRIRRGDPQLMAELTSFAVSARNQSFVKETLAKSGLDRASDDGIRARLPAQAKLNAPDWARVYLYKLIG